jgi:glycosyltransferase involved in cell wall biosynthesis
LEIHSICIAKNEADIIEQTLKAALYWSDFIYVFDNGSTDSTWEKVLELSTENKQIIPYKQENCKFHQGLRSEVFEYYRSKCKVGDWWCRLDADEIYVDDPRVFLAKIPQKYKAVWNASFQYYFTDKDLERYNQDPSLYANDIPVEQKCRYYLNNWSEMRFLRHDEKLVWDKNRAWPYYGAVYPVRIWLRHYQYRSPQQIHRRVIERLQARAIGYSGFRHEAQANWSDTVRNLSPTYSSNLDIQPNDELWKERIVDSSQLNYDAHDRKYVLRKDLMPKLPSISPFVVNNLREFKKYKGFRRLLNS